MSGWAIRAALFVTAMLFFVGALVGGCTYKLSTRTFTISGRSMAPAFDDGSSVSVRTDRSPQRFDIVAFRKFWDRNQPAIGRVVGLPGEAVVIQGNRASIDGAHLNDPFGLGTPSTYSVHVTLGDDEFLVLEDQRAIGDDSSTRGPVKRSDILGSTSAKCPNGDPGEVPRCY